MSYNLTLQQQVDAHDTFQIGYVGNVSRHQIILCCDNSVSQMAPPSYVYNAYDPTSPIHYPQPNFVGNASYQSYNGDGNYNSMQAVWMRRMSRDLTVNANYTWAKCMTDVSNNASSSVARDGYRAQWLPGFGIRGDYGLCGSDVKNVVHVTGSYKLPFGRGQFIAGHVNHLTDMAIGGWVLNYIYTWQSGIPFTIPCYKAESNMGCNALVVPGSDMYAPNKSTNQWLNPNAFADPQPATVVGQTDIAALGGGSYQARAPGMKVMDMSMLKNFAIKDQLKVQFRAEAFNVGNWVSWGIPGNLNFASPDKFSQITYDTQTPRVLQLALKIYY